MAAGLRFASFAVPVETEPASFTDSVFERSGYPCESLNGSVGHLMAPNTIECQKSLCRKRFSANFHLHDRA